MDGQPAPDREARIASPVGHDDFLAGGKHEPNHAHAMREVALPHARRWVRTSEARPSPARTTFREGPSRSAES